MASQAKNNPRNKGNNKAANSPKHKNTTAKARAADSSAPKGLMTAMDGFFERHIKTILPVSVLLTILFGILLFDVKISTGGDDSGYVEMADNFLKGRSFPTWHGYLYSIFLSLPILIFGVNVIVLKIISFLFIIGHLILFYFTFRRRLSATVFIFTLLIITVNSTILYFASQTYSEAMFMFLQALAVFLFVNFVFTYLAGDKVTFKGEALRLLIIGFVLTLTSLTREIGLAALIAMILFLLVYKHFRASVLLLASYSLFFGIFRIYRAVVWGVSDNVDKISEILQKNPYNKALGHEDFGGMVDRFLANANQYLSKHFMIGIGLHDPASTEKSWLVTILLVVLFLIAVFFAFKNKNKLMQLVGIYLAGAMTATFIVLSQSWDQMRMVIVFIPMALIFLSWGMLQLSKVKSFRIFAFILPLLLGVMLFKTLGQTIDKSKANQKVLARNMKGNLYYGFTPDWQNFLRMSEWVGKHIPKDQLVASRKPSMSYIYSKGRDFYGMYRFPTEPPEDFINKLTKRTGNLMVIPNASVRRDWPAKFQMDIKRANVACVAEGNDIFGVYDLKGQRGNELMIELLQKNVQPFTTDSLLNRLRLSRQSSFAVSPDSLINNLRRNNVEYVIVASLRANPKMNTGNVINNIQRYLYFVEHKYPGILKLVHQIGADKEEPAWLYKIEYSFYGL